MVAICEKSSTDGLDSPFCVFIVSPASAATAPRTCTAACSTPKHRFMQRSLHVTGVRWKPQQHRLLRPYRWSRCIDANLFIDLPRMRCSAVDQQLRPLRKNVLHRCGMQQAAALFASTGGEGIAVSCPFTDAKGTLAAGGACPENQQVTLETRGFKGLRQNHEQCSGSPCGQDQGRCFSC